MALASKATRLVRGFRGKRAVAGETAFFNGLLHCVKRHSWRGGCTWSQLSLAEKEGAAPVTASCGTELRLRLYKENNAREFAQGRHLAFSCGTELKNQHMQARSQRQPIECVLKIRIAAVLAAV